MFKVNISIYNVCAQFDDEAYVTIDIPFIPQVGNYIHLSTASQQALEEKIKPKADLYPDNLSKGDRFGVDDYIIVCAVGYTEADNQVWVELIDVLNE